MTLRLSVDEKAWGDHVRRTVLALGDVMPVVKGNGYGFGRSVLMPHAAAIARDVAVGSVYELVDVPDAMRPFVLTPVGVGVDAAIGNTVRRDAVLTVAAPHDLQQLGRIGARNSVVVKLQSSMHRYGVELSGATALRTQPSDSATKWSRGRCIFRSRAATPSASRRSRQSRAGCRPTFRCT